jgi:flagella basal body P-ring formation protein FlgA
MRSAPWVRAVVGVSLLACLAGTGVAAPAAAPIQLTLRDSATARGRYFTLGDVAEVTADSAELEASVRSTPLGAAPRVGHVEQFTRDELIRTLRMRMLPQVLAISESGARAVKVRTLDQSIDPPRIVELATAHLSARLVDRFDKVTVRVAEMPRELAVPAGMVSYHPRPLDAAAVAARMPVWVDVAIDGAVYRSIVVPFAVQAYRQALVARRDIGDGARLVPDDFDSVTTDAAQLVGEPVAAGELQAGVRAKKGLAAGQVLMRMQLAAPDAVLRGDAVTLLVAAGAVSIEASAIAQQDGGRGQLVRVKTDTATETVTGRVIAAGLVHAEGR